MASDDDIVVSKWTLVIRHASWSPEGRLQSLSGAIRTSSGMALGTLQLRGKATSSLLAALLAQCKMTIVDCSSPKARSLTDAPRFTQRRRF